MSHRFECSHCKRRFTELASTYAAQLATACRLRLHLRSRNLSSSSATPSISVLSTSNPPITPCSSACSDPLVSVCATAFALSGADAPFADAVAAPLLSPLTAIAAPMPAALLSPTGAPNSSARLPPDSPKDGNAAAARGGVTTGPLLRPIPSFFTGPRSGVSTVAPPSLRK